MNTEKQKMTKIHDIEDEEVCDHVGIDQDRWVAKNISELMARLLQGYDRRVRPYFEGKVYIRTKISHEGTDLLNNREGRSGLCDAPGKNTTYYIM